MQYDWDENKREANLIKHGIDFDSVSDFELATKLNSRDQFAQSQQTGDGIF